MFIHYNGTVILMKYDMSEKDNWFMFQFYSESLLPSNIKNARGTLGVVALTLYIHTLSSPSTSSHRHEHTNYTSFELLFCQKYCNCVC